MAKTFIISVTNVNEAPTAISLVSGGTVADNATTGTVVATVAGTDPDAGSVLSYSLTQSDNGLFAIDAASGVITVANAALLPSGASSPPVTVRLLIRAGLPSTRP